MHPRRSRLAVPGTASARALAEGDPKIRNGSLLACGAFEAVDIGTNGCAEVLRSPIFEEAKSPHTEIPASSGVPSESDAATIMRLKDALKDYIVKVEALQVTLDSEHIPRQNRFSSCQWKVVDRGLLLSGVQLAFLHRRSKT